MLDGLSWGQGACFFCNVSIIAFWPGTAHACYTSVMSIIFSCLNNVHVSIHVPFMAHECNMHVDLKHSSFICTRFLVFVCMCSQQINAKCSLKKYKGYIYMWKGFWWSQGCWGNNDGTKFDRSPSILWKGANWVTNWELYKKCMDDAAASRTFTYVKICDVL